MEAFLEHAKSASRIIATLDPYTKVSVLLQMAERLEKDTLLARQLSARGGTLYCKHQGERVTMSGTAVLFMQGEIYL